MGLKVCVLQPDYSTSSVDYQYYDPPRQLSHLMPDADFEYVSLNKLTTYKQLMECSKKNFDIYVNLCEGYLEWEVPSIDVIQTLDLLKLPYTGPTATLYDPPKTLMKYLAYCEDVNTPPYHEIKSLDDAKKIAASASYPLFVKPAKAGDSLGIDHGSLVNDGDALIKKVVVAANTDGKTCRSFKPVEYIFPEGFAFKTYALKTSELHPGANIPCKDPSLEKELRDAAEKIFRGFSGEGYARMDFRVDKNGKIYFLEVNFTCSVFYADGYEGSADYILKFDGIGQAGFLQHIIEEGVARYQRKQKAYEIRGNSIAGYGIYAKRLIKKGETLYRGEERPTRIVSKGYVDQHWDEHDKLKFRQYAYPLGGDTYAIWDEEPHEWSPQNHSCAANCAMEGLNMIAARDIQQNEELTLDYAYFLDKTMEPFECNCGAVNCRKTIKGVNS
ncbi:MAG: SET domain-containing protein-lysine N-methyltransferase [Chitinophagaceae bacterium]|nr:SET domain-containing protein-lysine N-methyltransferase [Chitinophagaceae bacterium]